MSRYIWLWRCALMMFVASGLVDAQQVKNFPGSADVRPEGRVYTAQELDKLPVSRMYLHGAWQIQSSCEVKATGAQISTLGFDASGWHAANVPTTAVGAL